MAGTAFSLNYSSPDGLFSDGTLYGRLLQLKNEVDWELSRTNKTFADVKARAKALGEMDIPGQKMCL